MHGLVLEGVDDGVPGDVGGLAEGDVVIEGGLEVAAEGDAAAEVEAEGGLLEGEVVAVTLEVFPVEGGLAEVEVELRPDAEVDAGDAHEVDAEAGVGGQLEGLLLERLGFDAEVALVIEGRDVDGESYDGRVDAQLRAEEESGAVGAAEGVARELHVDDVGAAAQAELHGLCLSGEGNKKCTMYNEQCTTENERFAISTFTLHCTLFIIHCTWSYQ